MYLFINLFISIWIHKYLLYALNYSTVSKIIYIFGHWEHSILLLQKYILVHKYLCRLKKLTKFHFKKWNETFLRTATLWNQSDQLKKQDWLSKNFVYPYLIKRNKEFLECFTIDNYSNYKKGMPLYSKSPILKLISFNKHLHRNILKNISQNILVVWPGQIDT